MRLATRRITDFGQCSIDLNAAISYPDVVCLTAAKQGQ
jgi:hypothetical protein